MLGNDTIKFYLAHHTAMRYLFELSGEHPTLPLAELNASLDAEGVKYKITDTGERVVEIETKKMNVERMKGRLALCHEILLKCFSCELKDVKRIEQYADSVPIDATDGDTFCVRAKRIGDYGKNLNLSKIEKSLGGALNKKEKLKVNLDDPDIEVRVLLSDRCYVGIVKGKINRTGFEERKVSCRPFFSPISLHPRLARVLVNLSRVKKGETLLDPFCGTGGVLIEAGQMGVKLIGSDIDKRMVNGAKKNLEHFKIPKSKITACDVGDIGDFVKNVDAIATDPPYGRSATTNSEELRSLYGRAFSVFQDVLKDDGYLSITLPDMKYVKLGEKHLSLKEVYPARVHRSLTRYFCVYGHK